MKTSDFNLFGRVNAQENKKRGRDTTLTGKTDYILEKIRSLSNVAAEAWKSASKKYDPKEVDDVYIKRLLDLANALNTWDRGLGSYIANHVDDYRKKWKDPFTAISLIDYIIGHCRNKTETYLTKLPEVIDTIKGQNGADSSLMRYIFVSRALPGHNPGSLQSLESLAQEYARTYSQKPASANEEAEYYQNRCDQMFDGDMDRMRDFFSDGMRDTIASGLKKHESLNNAEFVSKDRLMDSVEE